MNVIAEKNLAVSDYLAEQQQKSLMRFLTCGSVDDGKSTLIGRLLYDSKLLFEDQLATLNKDSKKFGTTGDNIDFALLVDGLEAEREQGITIDVAYRFFTTDKRKFIVADTPGHEQYTRNMATGASTADLAIILIDARKGVLTQTRRHSLIAAQLGIRHIVVAVNKMDLVDFSEEVFTKIRADYEAFASSFSFSSVAFIPMSALKGDNVTSKSEAMAWYSGPALLPYLESVDVEDDVLSRPFRFPVQWVNRPHLDFRGFSGTVASGRVRVGDKIAVARSGQTSTIASIVTMDGEKDEAIAGEAVTLTLTDEIDASRGDVIVPVTERPEVSDQFCAHLIWMAEDALLPGRPYLLKSGARTVQAQISAIKHTINVNTGEHLAAKTLGLNDLAAVNIATTEPIAFDPYVENHTTGGFILIDRYTNQTVAAGMIEFGLRRASNVHWQALEVNKDARAEIKGQKPFVLWFTGLSGCGKSTIASILEKKLLALGKHTYTLDGDNVRHGLNRDLGFTDADRVENIRRVAEVSRLMVDAGLIVLVSFISPFKAERALARERLGEGEFVEVYVNTPLEVCEARDVKGLYAKARRGEIKNFTGIDSPYEPPETPELVVSTVDASAEDVADDMIRILQERGVL